MRAGIARRRITWRSPLKSACPALLPAPAVLQQSLHRVTERFAAELGCPREDPPAWSEFDWTVARAVIAIHGIASLLCRSLRWQGPVEFNRFLNSQHTHTTRRHARIGELLRRMDGGAKQAGIAAVALKGVALYELGLYESGDRPMADIDLLVRPADSGALAALLESMGYRLSSAGWREKVFVPAGAREPAGIGEHADNSVKVEIHEHIGERLACELTDISARIFPDLAHPGLNPYPSKGVLMLHLLLHAAGSMSRQGLRLVQLHDIALLSKLMAPSDWTDMLAGGAHPRSLWWAFPPLHLVARYYGAQIPDEVSCRTAAQCPAWLRRRARDNTLYAVSHSYPWIDAFPAMIWSRSLREAARYALNRLWPSSQLRAARERELSTELRARQDDWSHRSQGRRVLRWLVSRPTRQATLQVVAAAGASTGVP